jgi:hypothetical protein
LWLPGPHKILHATCNKELLFFMALVWKVEDNLKKRINQPYVWKTPTPCASLKIFCYKNKLR